MKSLLFNLIYLKMSNHFHTSGFLVTDSFEEKFHRKEVRGVLKFIQFMWWQVGSRQRLTGLNWTHSKHLSWSAQQSVRPLTPIGAPASPLWSAGSTQNGANEVTVLIAWQKEKLNTCHHSISFFFLSCRCGKRRKKTCISAEPPVSHGSHRVWHTKLVCNSNNRRVWRSSFFAGHKNSKIILSAECFLFFFLKCWVYLHNFL